MTITYIETDEFRVELGQNYLDIDERPARSGRVLNIIEIDPDRARVRGQVISPGRRRGKVGRRVWLRLDTLRSRYTLIEG